MKRGFLFGSWVVCGGMALFAVPVANVGAQNSPVAPANTPAAVSTTPVAPVQLSENAAEVLKLTRAKINDDTILAFIQNSRSSYGLNTSAIVYLHNEGMSDRIITAMLNREQKLVAAPWSAPQTAAASVAPAAGSMNPGNAQYAQAPATYAQAAPPSTVYVVPDSVPYYYYPDYSYYPYYYYYPGVSLSFGFGNYWYWSGGHRYYWNGNHGGSWGGGSRGGGPPGGGSRGGGLPGGGGRGGGSGGSHH